MTMTLPVTVYGNADLYRELFNAIAATMGDSAFGHLIKFVIALTGTWVIVRYSIERSLMPFIRWLLLYYMAFYVAFFPKVTVEILDQTNPSKAYTVDHVPLGLGIIASYSSAIGAGLTQLMEKNFSVPDDLNYQKTGMAMAARLVLASTQFQVTDSDFAQSLHSFVQQCIFYDLLLQKYTWNDLLHTAHIWQWVSAHAARARSFRYVKSGNPHIITCQEGAARLTQDWQAAIQEATVRYGAWSFVGNQAAKSALLSHLESSYHFLTQISEDAASLMQQAMMANAVQSGLADLNASSNAAAAMQAYALMKAQQQKRLTNITVGDMAAYWLPLMKNVLEATLYGAFIFVFLLFLFPFGPSILKNYVASLLWIQCWAPLYAILNLFISFYAQKHTLGAIQLGHGQVGLTLATQGSVAQVNADVASLAGYLSLSVPLLAAGITKGMMSVFSQAAQYMGGVTQSVASSSSGEAISGNLSLGNTQFSNHSHFNASGHHVDTSARVFSGMYSTQMAGGSTLSMTSDGTVIMNNQSALSNLGTSINLAHAMRDTASTQADTAYSSALTAAHVYSESVAAGMRNLYELGNHLNHSEASGTRSSVSLSAGVSSALNTVHQLTNRFGQAHHLSHSQALKHLSAAYLAGRAGISGSASTPGILPLRAAAQAGLEMGGRVETDSLRSDDQGEMYSAAQDFIHNTQFSKHVDKAVRGIQEQHFRSSDEQGQRLSESVGSSFERASAARHEMLANYQQSQSYREMASHAEENATSINSNANQALMQWLQKQPELQHSGVIEKLMTQDPVKAQAYVQQFVQEQVSQHAHLPTGSTESIQGHFEEGKAFMAGDQRVTQIQAEDQTQINEAAKKLKSQRINRHTAQEAREMIHNNEATLSSHQATLTQQVETKRQEVAARFKKADD